MLTDTVLAEAIGYAQIAGEPIDVFDRGGQIDMYRHSAGMIGFGASWRLLAIVDASGNVYRAD